MNDLTTTTAHEINTLHEGLLGLLSQGIEKAVRIGELLTAKKAELKHGEFIPWIKENLVFTDRTARNYMTLFENKDKALEAGNVTEAYKMLAEHKTEIISDLDAPDVSDDFLDDQTIIQEITDRFFNSLYTIESLEWDAWGWMINIYYKGLHVEPRPSVELETKEIVLYHDDELYPDENLRLGRTLRLLITRDFRLIKIMEFHEKRFGHVSYLKDAYRLAELEYDPRYEQISQYDLIPLMVEQAKMII